MSSIVVNPSTPRFGNLPADVTSFVGRRNELVEVKRLLSDARLVTLTGVGGVGKTRLALRAASSVHRAFGDQVWLVDLARLSDPSLVPQAVAETLQLAETSRRDPLDILADQLRDRQLLLVLDNCEHLLHESAVLADRLLKAAPRLRILATSRQALNVPNERMLLVPPLPLPSLDGAEAPEDQTLEQYGAVALFVQRAVAVQFDFVLDDDNRDAVVGICRRLDGIPLAIELAAARLRTLSPQQILERLGDRYKLLTTGPRSVAPRHQSLQALIDWSYELMSTQERLLSVRSSVFAGSFDLSAAEAVCAGDGIQTDDIIDLIAELIDKSLLEREVGGRIARYAQLDTIREYGRHRLVESGEDAAVRSRHREYHQEMAEQTARKVFGPDQVEWFARLQQEHADLRAALEYSVSEPAERQHGLRMAADLLYHWLDGSFLNEGRAWMDRLLALDPAPTPARADALWSNSWLAIIQGDIPAAQAMLEEARSLGEELDLPAVLGYSALFAGFAAMYTGNVDQALASYEEALARHRAIGNRHGVALTLIRTSLAYSFRGDAERAIALAEECLDACDEAGDSWHKSYALNALGIQVWRQGDTRRATAIEQDSLRLNHALDSRLGIALNLEVLAWIAATTGEYERAARLLGILRTRWQQIGAPLSGYGHLKGYHDTCVERTRNNLSAGMYAAFLEDGAELGIHQAIAYGLQEKEPSARSAGRVEASRLTRREREIAQLVAEGQSNKEIASALVIAQRTAESHVENILVKLGFTSRAQIAAWVAANERAPSGE